MMYSLLSLIILILPSTPNIQVYFEEDTLSKKLAYFISNAQYSLDICFHQFYDYEVIDSTLSAWNRGVKVRVITEHDYINYNGTQELEDAGIPVIDEGIGGNSTDHRMHNKFIIRDFRDQDTTNNAVWVGSFNASGFTHADNAILVKSYALSRIFEAEFNQMWGDTGDTPNGVYALTGSNKHDECPFHQVNVDGTLLEAYFSPYNRIQNHILDYINLAQSEIDFLMFTFTNYAIYDAMGMRFMNDSVMVYGVLDYDLEHDWNRDAYNYFNQHNIPVVWDNYDSGHGSLLHDKVMIVDDSIVFMGSYNFTLRADTSNDESCVIIHSPEIATLYKNEFTKLYYEEVNEQSPHNLCRNKPVILKSNDLLRLLQHKSFTILRPDGSIIHNLYNIKGVVFLKSDKTWQKLLIIR